VISLNILFVTYNFPLNEENDIEISFDRNLETQLFNLKKYLWKPRVRNGSDPHAVPVTEGPFKNQRSEIV
jgi:hypothetical protein